MLWHILLPLTLLVPAAWPVGVHCRSGPPRCLTPVGDAGPDAAPPPRLRSFSVPGRRVLVNVEGLEADALASEFQEDAMALLVEAKLEAELSLTLCDGPFIQRLNAEWRGVDRETDVLSFPMDDDVIIGDVVVCVGVARRQADERGYELRDELRVLLVHGLLHLLGYDHETGEEDAAEMREAEGRLLRNLGWEGEGLVAAAEAGG